MSGLNLRLPHHLPNLRPDRRALNPSWLPRQRRGVTPQMVGRYPDFDVFDAQSTWDPATRRVIEARMRVRYGDPLRFFTIEEGTTGRVLCDLCTAQDDEPRIPVLELIDQRLALGKLDGYQYDDMPDDRDTWRLVLAGLDEAGRERYGAAGFAALDNPDARDLITQFAAGQLYRGAWEKLNVKRAWSVCTRMIASSFYSHPWAWNEIGFGGPAYPRGFMRLGPVGVLEPFEKPGATDEDPVAATERDHR